MLSAWILILLFSLAVAVLMSLNYRQHLVSGLKLGLFLAIFDWVVENLGEIFGLWYSKGSVFWLRAVPLEVFLTCICVGTVYYMLFTKWEDLGIGVLSSLCIAVIGMVVERELIRLDNLVYWNWNSIAALIAYFITFLILYKVKDRT